MNRLLPLAGPFAWRGLMLLAAAAAVTTELAFPWEQPSDMTLPSLTEPAVLRRPDAPPPASYTAIAQHPLFYPSRTPWVPPREAPAAATPALGPLTGYTLAGTVISGGTRSAILFVGATSKTMLIAQGEALNGWTLQRIDADGLHFEGGGQTFVLAFPPPRQSGR